jgi:hypothetical protein
METLPSATWNLGFSSATREDDSGDNEDEDSVNSTGSCITLESHSPTIVPLNSIACAGPVQWEILVLKLATNSTCDPTYVQT